MFMATAMYMSGADLYRNREFFAEERNRIAELRCSKAALRLRSINHARYLVNTATTVEQVGGALRKLHERHPSRSSLEYFNIAMCEPLDRLVSDINQLMAIDLQSCIPSVLMYFPPVFSEEAILHMFVDEKCTDLKVCRARAEKLRDVYPGAFICLHDIDRFAGWRDDAEFFSYWVSPSCSAMKWPRDYRVLSKYFTSVEHGGTLMVFVDPYTIKPWEALLFFDSQLKPSPRQNVRVIMHVFGEFPEGWVEFKRAVEQAFSLEVVLHGKAYNDDLMRQAVNSDVGYALSEGKVDTLIITNSVMLADVAKKYRDSHVVYAATNELYGRDLRRNLERQGVRYFVLDASCRRYNSVEYGVSSLCHYVEDHGVDISDSEGWDAAVRRFTSFGGDTVAKISKGRLLIGQDNKELTEPNVSASETRDEDEQCVGEGA